jgi:hypothetical protein
VGDAGAVTAGARRGPGGSWLRAVTGLLAGGLVALAVALVVAWIIADRIGSPGPGPGTLVWHGLAAVGAVLGQRVADRQAGALGWAAMAAVVAITAAVLAVQWLA